MSTIVENRRALKPRPIFGRLTGVDLKRLVGRRFHELVVKHALQTATPEEEAKLKRYTKLRRSMLGNDGPRDERQEHRIRYWLKELTRFRRMDNRQKYSPVAMRPPNSSLNNKSL